MTDIQIRPLDPTDDAEFAAFQRVYERAALHRTPHVPIYGEAESRPHFMPSEHGRRALVRLAWVGDRMVGQANAFCPPVGDADREAWCSVLVDPEWTRRGIGGRLAQALTEVVRQEGLTSMGCDVALPPGADLDDGYVRFARRHGFVVGQVEVTRRLDLPIDAGRLDALATQAAAHHDGYVLETVVGPLPEPLVQPFLDLDDLIDTEAPTGAMIVSERHTTRTEFAQEESRLVEAGQLRIVTLAWSPSGEAVAATNLVVGPVGSGVARQMGTIVRPAHRGHRLGIAVKVANLAALHQCRPDVTRVEGVNAESNAHMGVVNTALGFIETGRSVEMQRLLPGHPLHGAPSQ